jgi:hypothetical protein
MYSATRENAAAKSWLRPHLPAISANDPAQAWGGGPSDDGTGWVSLRRNVAVMHYVPPAADRTILGGRLAAAARESVDV